MRAILAIVLVVALVTLVLAHVSIVVALVRRREFVPAALALFVPPLAPLYGGERGMKVAMFAWLAGFGVYGVVLAFT